MTVVNMSDKEVEASISLLHMMQPSSSDAENAVKSHAGGTCSPSENKDALHNSLLKVVASQAMDELSRKRKEKSKKMQRRTAHLTALSHELTLDELRAHFGKPIVEVARELGICTTFLKKICRRLGIKRWPHRQIRSLARTIQMLEQVEAVATTPQEKNKYETQIAQLKEKQRAVMANPDANGKLKRVKKYAAPKATTGNIVASMSSLDQNEYGAMQLETAPIENAGDGSSNGNVEGCSPLVFVANSFLSAPRLESVMSEGNQLSDPLLVAIPESPPLAVEIPPPTSMPMVPSPSSLTTTPLHATASNKTQSPLVLRISPSNHKLALVKVGTGAGSRLRSSSIGSLQD